MRRRRLSRGVDLETIARESKGLSCAALEMTCLEATLRALGRYRRRHARGGGRDDDDEDDGNDENEDVGEEEEASVCGASGADEGTAGAGPASTRLPVVSASDFRYALRIVRGNSSSTPPSESESS